MRLTPMRQRRPKMREAIWGISSARMCRYSSKSEGLPRSTEMTLPAEKKLSPRRYLAARVSTDATKVGVVQLFPSSSSREDTITV